MKKKIKKKGGLPLRLIIVAIGLIFLCLVILGGWNTAFGKGKDKVEEQIDNSRDSQKVLQGDSKVDPALEESFYKFAELLEKSKSKNCLMKYNDFFKVAKDYFVDFSIIDKDTYIYMYKEKKKQEDILKTDATISNKASCVINAKNFYNNCINGNDCKNKDNIIEVDLTIKDKKISFKEKKAALKDENIMFQLDESHVCFLPTQGDLLGACDTKEDFLDDDCIQDVINKISFCS